MGCDLVDGCRYLQLVHQGKWVEAVSLGVALVPLLAYHPDIGISKSYLDSDTYHAMHTRLADSDCVRNATGERPLNPDDEPEFGSLQGAITTCKIQILCDVTARVGGPGCLHGRRRPRSS